MNTLANPCRFDEWPDIPGGWKEITVRVLDRRFRLSVPAHPDAFLDAPETQEANARDDYMPYWAYLWPASSAMARAVCSHPWPRGTAALEIGCGVGLVGLAAASCGLQVTFSDYDEAAVRTAVANAQANQFSATRGSVIDWRNSPERQFPVIFGCDVLYEVRNHAPLLQFLDSALADDGQVWLGDPGRAAAADFIDVAERRGFAITLLDADAALVHDFAPGVFRIIALQRAAPGQASRSSVAFREQRN